MASISQRTATKTAAQIADEHGVSRPSGSIEGQSVYRIPCPAHKGKGPNLAIWDGRDGGLGARCHSHGCSYQSIIDALGVEFVYEGRSHQNGAGQTITRRRGHGKDMTGNRGSSKGVPVVLLGPGGEARDHIEGCAVVLPEGEKAAHALACLRLDGYQAAYWVGGTGGVGSADYSPLKGLNVIVWPDNDKPGAEAGEKAAQKCIDAGAASVRMVDTEGLDKGTDAADVDRDRALELLESAEEITMPSIGGGLGGMIKGSAPGSGLTIDKSIAGFRRALEAATLELCHDARVGGAYIRPRNWEQSAAPDVAAWYDRFTSNYRGYQGWVGVSPQMLASLLEFMEETFRSPTGRPYKPTDQDARRAIAAIGIQRDFVKEWFKNLPPWDGKGRVDRLFIDVLGAEDTELNRAAARLLCIGAVRRTFEPGCQHDETPVLVGAQGVGKSTFCRALLPDDCDDWFVPVDKWDDGKELWEAAGQALIVEFGEIVGLQRIKREALKATLSRAVDRHRPAYGRDAISFPRRWVGVGTTNESGQGVLPDDPSGNRRFVIVEVDPPGGTKAGPQLIREYMGAHRNQIWAEALYRYLKGEQSHIPAALFGARDSLNEEYVNSSEDVGNAVAILTASYVGTGTGHSLEALYLESGLPLDQKPRLQRKFADALTGLRWKRRTIKRGGARLRAWFPPKKAPAPSTLIESIDAVIRALPDNPPPNVLVWHAAPRRVHIGECGPDCPRERPPSESPIPGQLPLAPTPEEWRKMGDLYQAALRPLDGEMWTCVCGDKGFWPALPCIFTGACSAPPTNGATPNGHAQDAAEAPEELAAQDADPDLHRQATLAGMPQDKPYHP